MRRPLVHRVPAPGPEDDVKLDILEAGVCGFLGGTADPRSVDGNGVYERSAGIPTKDWYAFQSKVV